jgi:hypothetical protein
LTFVVNQFVNEVERNLYPGGLTNHRPPNSVLDQHLYDEHDSAFVAKYNKRRLILAGVPDILCSRLFGEEIFYFIDEQIRFELLFILLETSPIDVNDVFRLFEK